MKDNRDTFKSEEFLYEKATFEDKMSLAMRTYVEECVKVRYHILEMQLRLEDLRKIENR